MMKLKLFGTAIAALGLLAVSFSAKAADIPRPVYKSPVHPVVAYYNWTGFYIGINGGYVWGTSEWTVPPVSLKPTGWLVGGTLGYNYQIGSFVLGIEGDYDWANVKGSDTCAVISTCETKSTYLATARGRLGYAFDRWMPYVTGGAAFGDIKATSSLGLVSVTSSKNQIGWTAGGGLEYAFLGNWSGKIEYLYVDLGSFDPGFATPVVMNVNLKENVIRAGLNYKFSGPIFSRF